MSQRVFVVVGAKGGVGTSTIAIKLIQRFPAQAERLIVDADLTGKRTLAVWYDLIHDLDLAGEIGSASVATAKGGLLVMELARTYEDGTIQTSASIIRALAGLSERALIVVDAPQPFAATVRPFIAGATKIIVITDPSMMGIGVARAVLAAMDRFGIPASRIALVLSDLAGKDNVPRTDVERALGMPVSAELPNGRDRRYEALFDGFVTMLAAASVSLEEPGQPTEKPVFDRRIESGEALL
jgi:Flp pilus assembly CpaE family ATPase